MTVKGEEGGEEKGVRVGERGEGEGEKGRGEGEKREKRREEAH